MAASAAPALRFLPPSSLSRRHLRPSRRKHRPVAGTVVLACASTPSNQDTAGFEPNPQPYEGPQAPATFDLDRPQRRSAIVRDRRPGTAVQKPEPPNLEIGWKRTKEIDNEKPKGFVIADFLEKLDTLMGRGQYGSAELLAKVGGIVAERAREEAEVLVEGGEVEDRLVTELHRVLRLMEMDLEMVKAAVMEETLAQRVEQARARCRQAILVALSF